MWAAPLETDGISLWPTRSLEGRSAPGAEEEEEEEEEEKQIIIKTRNRMTATVLKQDPNTKTDVQTNAYLFQHGHSVQIFGEIPFIKPQNNT